MDTNSFISVKVSSKSDFSFLSYAIYKTVAETRQMMVFHHPLHVPLTVLQKARLANCSKGAVSVAKSNLMRTNCRITRLPSRIDSFSRIVDAN